MPSAANTGYRWAVGTGFDKSGIIATTSPSLTLNYTNWGNPTPHSPTVAVGTVNSNCQNTGNGTALETLIDPTSPSTNDGVGVPAIPRTAWTQFSSGTPPPVPVINGPSTFYMSICGGSPSGALYSVTNLPTTTTKVTWSILNGAGFIPMSGYTGFLQTGLILACPGECSAPGTYDDHAIIQREHVILLCPIMLFLFKICLVRRHVLGLIARRRLR